MFPGGLSKLFGWWMERTADVQEPSPSNKILHGELEPVGLVVNFATKLQLLLELRQESFPLCPKGLGEWRHSIYGSDGSSCHAEQSRRFEGRHPYLGSGKQYENLWIWIHFYISDTSLKLPNVTSCMCSFLETSSPVKYSTWKQVKHIFITDDTWCAFVAVRLPGRCARGRIYQAWRTAAMDHAQLQYLYARCKCLNELLMNVGWLGVFRVFSMSNVTYVQRMICFEFKRIYILQTLKECCLFMFALQEIRGNSKFQKTYPRILQGTPSTFGPTPAGHFISWRRDPHQSLSLTRWDILGGQWNIVLVGCTGSHLGCSTFVEQSSIIANFPMVKNPSFSVVIMSLILGSGQMKNNKTLFWFSLKKLQVHLGRRYQRVVPLQHWRT